ncbi:superoxide dismutase, Ni [Maridesulfovibrio sp.]|uniref:superoxide dismutase, Ni n=1 Tax=Maridesulfovibrio sp. TaxID=2795000 RepID=UPI003B00B803
MLRKTITGMSILMIIVLVPVLSSAHCQVPCGIYDDHARVEAMLEDVKTVKKAVTMLQELAEKTDVQSRQQFTRWVMNKEHHAQLIISTISDYFLTQRVKATQKDYVERLKRHHAVIVNAMNVKQNADIATVDELEASVKALEGYYPAEHKH